MLDVEDWAEIRRLRKAEGMPIKVIARVMGCSKNTVKAALAADGPPSMRGRSRGSVVDVVEPRIRELLQATPTMPATVIAERIGWPYSIRVLRDRVAELRPVYLPPDPASRTTYLAGEIGQCDFWFPPVELPVGFGQVRTADPVAGVDHDHWVCPVRLGAAGPDPLPRRICMPAGGGCCRALGRGAAGVGVGRGGRDRSVAGPASRS